MTDQYDIKAIMSDGNPMMETEELVKLSFFLDIGKEISKTRTIDQTIQVIMKYVGEIFAPLNYSVMLRNSETGVLTFTEVIGECSDKLKGLQLPRGEGIAGWIAETKQPVIVEDVAKDSRFSSRVDHYSGFETRSIIGVPLISAGRVFGVIELINKLNGKLFKPLELKILTCIADFSAIAIEKAYYLSSIKRMANTDSLTGVYNRGAFERAYARHLDIFRRYSTPFAMLMVDVDDFKKINDTHGHLVGDEVLKNLTELLQACVRKVDSVYRYGGDEFVIILPNTDKKHAKLAKERIRQRIDYQNSLQPDVPYLVSIGVEAVDKKKDADVLAQLDTDLYRDKDRKFSRNYESIAEHLEDMLNEEKKKMSNDPDEIP